MSQPKEVYNAFADPEYWKWFASGAKKPEPIEKREFTTTMQVIRWVCGLHFVCGVGLGLFLGAIAVSLLKLL